MTPAEKIADDTWHKLEEARNLMVRLGEETLTDLLILDLKRHAAKHTFWVYQTTRKQEASSGTDLLVVVRAGTTGDAHLYAIQAKKLYPDGQYTALRKENNVQLDALETYACSNDALPYYLFYNCSYGSIVDPGKYWHCARNYDESQLGCTLVPSSIVRAAMGAPRQFRPRSFEYLHEPRQALPMRCLFDCPHWERELGDRWLDSEKQRSLGRGIPSYGWVNVDPVPGAWPIEMAGDDVVDLAPIAERYADNREENIAPGSHLPAFRPRRFIFVDKGVQ